MPTFNFKTYEPKADIAPNATSNSNVEVNTDKEESKKSKAKDFVVTISGPLSEIVAQAANNLFKKDNELEQAMREEEKQERDNETQNVESKEIDDSPQEEKVDIYALSAEDINKDPISNFKNILKLGQNTIVYISNESKKPFSTDREEWFLRQLYNNGYELRFTQESLFSRLLNR